MKNSTFFEVSLNVITLHICEGKKRCVVLTRAPKEYFNSSILEDLAGMYKGGKKQLIARYHYF